MCRGFFELTPLLAYLTTALQDSVVNFGLNYTEAGQQGVGNLYTSYVQNIVDGNPPADEVTAAPTSNVSTGVFASLTNQPIIGGAFLPVSSSTLVNDVGDISTINDISTIDVATWSTFCMLYNSAMPCNAITAMPLHAKCHAVLQSIVPALLQWESFLLPG